MSTNLHPTIARDMRGQDLLGNDKHGEDETEQALNRATARPAQTGNATEDTGKDKRDDPGAADPRQS